MPEFDTIAAIATAPAVSAIGVVRLSGPDALEIAARVFFPASGSDFSACPPREMVYGEIKDGIRTIDRSLAVRMEAPRSFTGENMVELHCHGGVRLLARILELLCLHGARTAAPGEYTRRAFLNGKLDLAEAEAVMDLIEAETDAAVDNAAGQLSGLLSRRINESLDSLNARIAHYYAWMDYGEEGVEPPDTEDVSTFLSSLAAKLGALAGSHGAGRLMREGVSCAVVGRPNVGKSSIINAILGFERVIVSPEAGTTRDTVEEKVRFAGLPLRLTDTAGLRETDNMIEAQGVERTKRAIDGAGLVFAVFDGSEPLMAEDREVIALCAGHPAVALINKTDLPTRADIAEIERAFRHVVYISAKTGENVDVLEKTVAELLVPEGLRFDGSVVTNARHADLLRRAARAVLDAAEAVSRLNLPDACLSMMEEGVAALSEITGRNAAEEAVNEIFARFCVGK